jgi:hypothetical protein
MHGYASRWRRWHAMCPDVPGDLWTRLDVMPWWNRYEWLLIAKHMRSFIVSWP